MRRILDIRPNYARSSGLGSRRTPDLGAAEIHDPEAVELPPSARDGQVEGDAVEGAVGRGCVRADEGLAVGVREGVLHECLLRGAVCAGGRGGGVGGERGIDGDGDLEAAEEGRRGLAD